MVTFHMRASFLLAAFFSFILTTLAADQKFVLTSTSFKADGIIAAKYAMKAVKGGRNISPELSWSNAPKETTFFALVCVDTNPIARDWVHWAVLNIPVSVKKIAEIASPATMPKGCVELKNSFGFKGYGGPQPPRGTGVHQYVFTIYALKGKVDTQETFLPFDELRKVLKPLVIAKAELAGKFER